LIPAPVFQVWDEDGSTGLSTLEAVSEWAISDVRCDVGALTMSLPLDVTGAYSLLVDADRQIRVIMQGAPDQWFLFDDDSWAGISDAPDSEPRSIACRSLIGVADEVHLITDLAYTAGTPGEPIADAFSDAQARGFLQGLTLAGGTGLDAGGHTWPDTVTVTYKAGTSLLAMLKGLSDAGLVEWRMNGRELEIHKPGGDLDRTLPGLLQPGGDVKAAPIQRSRKSIASDVLVVEADGTTTVRTQALAGRRRREALVSQTNGTDTPPEVLGDLYLAAHATSDVQLTHDMNDGEDTPVPWVDYRPGDRLLTIAAGGGATSWRVAQIAMAKNGNQTMVNLVLGSILQVAEERFADQLAHLQPGAVVLT
jgi:hypothetical protein